MPSSCAKERESSIVGSNADAKTATVDKPICPKAVRVSAGNARHKTAARPESAMRTGGGNDTMEREPKDCGRSGKARAPEPAAGEVALLSRHPGRRQPSTDPTTRDTTKGPLGLGQMATDEYENARCTYGCVHYALPLSVRRQTRRRILRLNFQPMVRTRRLEPKSLEPKPKPGTNTGNLQRWVLWCQ